MKYLSFPLFLLAVVLMSSCASSFTHATYYIDYKEAGNSQLFITESNSVNFDYEPLGSILVEEIPGAVKVTVPITDKSNRSSYDDIYSAPTSKTVNSYSQATAQTALNYAAQKCLELGGDGLVNVKLNSYMDDRKRRVVQVTGMVIKRK